MGVVDESFGSQAGQLGSGCGPRCWLALPPGLGRRLDSLVLTGLGPGTAKFLLVFNNGAFKEGSTFSITDWLAHTPATWVAQNLRLTAKQVDQLPKEQVYISRRPPAPGPLSDTKPRAAGVKPLNESHVFDLTTQPKKEMRGGSFLQLASAKQFPASFNMTGAILHLEPGAMRAMHWHPNADEWQYVLNGSYDLSVFASEGQARVSSLKQGDVAYVPRGYGHALRNTSKGPTDVLVVFNDGDYQSINLNDWLATNPTSVVANNLQIPQSLSDQLPEANTDFIPQ